MLQKSPMYAYIPARDMARARKFYEEKVGLRPKEENAGGVTYEFGEDTACFLYPTGARGRVRGLRHARHEDRERHRHCRRRQGGMVQG